MSTTDSAAAATTATTYDVVPYPSASFPQSHPNRMAAMARLFGLEAVAPSAARVLELGCADGSNLLPMAESLPGASFLGIDASKVQVADGLKALAVSGLRNVELRCQDILDFGPAEGKFDYIVVHGIFSWVPDHVRDKILSICAANLAETGVAYISFNALPGWNMRRALREMMRFHTQGMKEPLTQVQQARALVKFLADAVPTEKNAYGLLLKSELDTMAGHADGYLLHDILEEQNTPYYFHDFVEMAGRVGLQYLSEPSLSQMLAANFPQEVRTTLARIGAGVVAQEQYMDFLRNRMFRQTLLCHAGRPIRRNVAPDSMRRFAFQSQLKPLESSIDLSPGVPVDFTTVHGMSVSTKDCFVKSLLVTLGEVPGVHAFETLLGEARRRSRSLLGEVPPDRDQAEEALLANNLLDLFAKGIVEIWSEPIAVAAGVPDRPMVTALARHQATRSRFVTNRLHQPVPADSVSRQVVQGCDGSRDLDGLLAFVADLVTAGKLQVKEGDQIITDPARLQASVRPVTEHVLQRLQKLGFFAP